MNVIDVNADQAPPRPPLPRDTAPPRPPPPETDDEDDTSFPVPQTNQPIMVRSAGLHYLSVTLLSARSVTSQIDLAVQYSVRNGERVKVKQNKTRSCWQKLQISDGIY